MQLGVVRGGGADFTSPVGLLCAHLPKHVRHPTGAVVFAWGVNEDGQLGLDERVNVGVPKVVHDFLGVQLAGRTFYRSPLVGGSRNTLAIDADGQVWSWGWNDRGTLGHGHRQPVGKPQRLSALAGIRITQVAVNGWHCLAVSDQGQMYAWGGNEYQQCGVDPERRDVLLPTPCLPQLKVLQVACGGMHSLALTEDGSVWTWGEPWGDFSLRAERRPRPVPGAVGMSAIAAGAFHNMALSHTGEVYTWGTNDYGQLGNGHTTYDTQPRRVVDMEGILVSDIAAGGWHSLALSVHGEVYTWGRGEYGRLGIGDTTGSSKLRAHKVRGLEGQVIVQVCAGGTHTLALGADGRLWSWGRASFGRLGSSTAAQAAQGFKEQDAYTPVEVCLPGGAARWSVVAVAAGGRHSMCLALPIHERPAGSSPAASENGALLSDSVEGGSEASLFCRVDGIGNGHAGEAGGSALPPKSHVSVQHEDQAASSSPLPDTSQHGTQSQVASFANLLPMDHQAQPATAAPAQAQHSGPSHDEGASVSSTGTTAPVLPHSLVQPLPGMATTSPNTALAAAAGGPLSVQDTSVPAAVVEPPVMPSAPPATAAGQLPGMPDAASTSTGLPSGNTTAGSSSLMVNPVFEPSTSGHGTTASRSATPINIPVASIRGDSLTGSPALSSPGANEQDPATLAGEVLAGSAEAPQQRGRHSHLSEEVTGQVTASASKGEPTANEVSYAAPNTTGVAGGPVGSAAAVQPSHMQQTGMPLPNTEAVAVPGVMSPGYTAPTIGPFPLSAPVVSELVMGASGELGSLPSIEFLVTGLGGNSPHAARVLLTDQVVGQGAWVAGASSSSTRAPGSSTTSPTRRKPHGMSAFIQAPESAATAAASAPSPGQAGIAAVGMEGLISGHTVPPVRTGSPLSRASSRISLASSNNSPRHTPQANHLAATAASMIGAGMTRTGSAGYTLDMAEGSDAGGLERAAERQAGHEAGVATVADDSRPPPGAVLDTAWTAEASDMHELVDKSMEHEEDVEKRKAQRRAARHQLQQLRDSHAAGPVVVGSEDGAGSVGEAALYRRQSTADGLRDNSEDEEGEGEEEEGEEGGDEDDDDDGISSTSRVSFHAADAVHAATLVRPMSPGNHLNVSALRARGVVAPAGVAGSPSAGSQLLQPSLSINTGTVSPIRTNNLVEQAAIDVAARLAAAVVGSPRGAYNGSGATLFTDMLLGSGSSGNHTSSGRPPSAGPTLTSVTSAPNTARPSSAAVILPPAASAPLIVPGMHGSPFGEPPTFPSQHGLPAAPVPGSSAGSLISEGPAVQLVHAVSIGSEAGSTRSLGQHNSRGKSRESARALPRAASPALSGIAALPPAATPVRSYIPDPAADPAATAGRADGLGPSTTSAQPGLQGEEVHDALMASLGPPAPTPAHAATARSNDPSN